MIIDDQGWGAFKKGRRAYQRRSIANGAVACVASSSSVTLRVAGRNRVVRIGEHIEGGLGPVVCCGRCVVAGVLWQVCCGRWAKLLLWLLKRKGKERKDPNGLQSEVLNTCRSGQ